MTWRHLLFDQRSDQDGPDDLHGLVQPGERTQLAKGIGRIEAVSGEGDDRTVEAEEGSEKDYSSIPFGVHTPRTRICTRDKAKWSSGTGATAGGSQT